MVCYLLTGSWLAVFIALPRYNRYRNSSTVVKLLAVVQSYLVLIIILAILGASPTFGSDRACNHDRRYVIFGPMNAVHAGRKVGLTLYSILTIAYTIVTYHDYKHARVLRRLFLGTRRDAAGHLDSPLRQSSSDNGPMTVLNSATQQVTRNAASRIGEREQRHSLRVRATTAKVKRAATNPGLKPGIDGRILLYFILIVVGSALVIANTELLRHFNHPDDTDQNWSFGQVRPRIAWLLRQSQVDACGTDITHISDRLAGLAHRQGVLGTSPWSRTSYEGRCKAHALQAANSVQFECQSSC
jgi:hypothetical protein